MKALIWKEWRENLRWIPLPALLIIGPVGGFLGLGSLLDFGFYFYVSLIVALFASVLGFLQVVFEARGDKQALLLHRPLGRSGIFLAKAAVGIGLYLVAMAIPFAWAVWMAATPGHLAVPFRWPMILPLVADCLTGIVYYFAGMLAAERDARWYGSKCLGLAAGLLCTLLVWTLPEFGHALVAIAVIGGTVGLAAWGSFGCSGAGQAMPVLGKAALAATLLLGLLTVSFAGNYFLGRWLMSRTIYTDRLDRSGRPITIHRSDEEHEPFVVTDSTGNTPADFQGQRLDDYHAIDELSAPEARGHLVKNRSYRSGNRFMVKYSNALRPGYENWFYSPDEGRVLGYDRQSKRFLGSFGPAGFALPGQSASDRFHGRVDHTSRFPEAVAAPYLAFRDGVYTIDFRGRSVRAIYSPQPGETILWAVEWENRNHSLSRAFVGSDQAIYAFDESGSRLFTAPLAYEAATYRIERVGWLEGVERFWVWYRPHGYLPLETLEILPSYVVEYDRSGHEVIREPIAPRPGGAHPPDPGIDVAEPSRSLAVFGLITPPAELAFLRGTTAFLRSDVQRGQGAERSLLLPVLEFTTQLFVPGVRWLPRTHPTIVLGYAGLMLVQGCGCSLACFWLARRRAASGRALIVWGLLGLTFGWAGLALMLACQDGPARIPCPRCRKMRIVTRDHCEHCGAAHAAPLADGTEVFESPTIDPLAKSPLTSVLATAGPAFRSGGGIPGGLL